MNEQRAPLARPEEEVIVSMTKGWTDLKTTAGASDASRHHEPGRWRAGLRRWLPCLALAIAAVFGTPNAEAHTKQSCVSVGRWVWDCGWVWDVVLDRWVWTCSPRWEVRYVCVNVAHRHETSFARDDRVMKEADACIARKVQAAIDDCLTRELPPHFFLRPFPDFPRCMADYYPNLWGYEEKLKEPYTNMRVARVKYPDPVSGKLKETLGGYTPPPNGVGTGEIGINVPLMRDMYRGAGNDVFRGTVLVRTIMHERMHALGVGHYPLVNGMHKTEHVAREILKEIFGIGVSLGSGCNIDWSLKVQ